MKTIAGNFALEFSRRLRSLLSANNINGVKLAEICNVNKTTAYDWINGNGFPKNDKLEIIANYFNVTINYLLGKDEEVSSIQYHLPNSIDSVEEAKSLLKSLNLYNFSDISLTSKNDKEILEFARALYYMLKMNI
jgi:transcriptional regulator with XRE-family HTH domain